MNKQFLLASIVAVATPVSAMAQSAVIKGTVVDSQNNEPIAGVTVVVQGTKVATITDENGKFSLKAPKGAKQNLQFSCVGYETQTLAGGQISSDRDLGFVPMSQTSVALKDAVVTTRAVARKTPVALTTLGSVVIEEKVGTADFPKVLESTPGVYVTREGGGYGDSKISMRGFKSENIAVLVNGVSMNDMEWGGVYWSNWAGLADVASSIQTQRGLGAAKVSTPSVGGSVNIVTKSTDAKKGGYFSYGMGNDGYNKLTFNLSTGRTKNGWALNLLGGRTWGDGYIQGSDFQGWNYFISISKDLGEHHMISLTAFGAPQWHNRRSSYDGLTVQGWQDVQQYMPYKEKYRYNATFGYDNQGRVRHSAQNVYHKPQIQLQHLWQISNTASLNTVAYLSLGYGGGESGMGTAAYNSSWYGTNNGVLNMSFRRADGTFDYGKVQDLNEKSESGSQMVMTMSNNQHRWYGLVSTFTKEMSERLNVYAGVDLRSYVGTHNNRITDLFNGAYYIDSYRANVKAANNSAAADPLFKYQKLSVGDIVRRDYDGHVNQGGVFGQAEYDYNNLTAFLSGSLSYTNQWRYDRFYYEKSKAESESHGSLGFTVKGGVNYKFPHIDGWGGQHNVFVNGGVISRSPYLLSSLFLSGDVSNEINPNAVNEKIYSVEAGWTYHTASFNFNLNAYHTIWQDKAMARSLDITDAAGNADRGLINMQGVNSLHQGIEAELDYKPVKWFSVRGMLSLGDWHWTNNAVGYFYNSQGQPLADAKGKIASGIYADDHAKMTLNQKGVKEGGSAQFTASLGFTVYPMEGLRIGLDWKHFSNYYADYSLSGRDLSINGVKNFETPWKVPAYSLVDLSAGYTFNMGGYKTTISGNVENLFDQEYISQAYDGAGHDWQTAYRVFYGFGRQMSIKLKVNF